MSDALPSDPARLRVMLAHLEQQLAENQTVQIYLRLQAGAVRAALAAAGRPTPDRLRQQPQPQRSALEVPALPVEQQLSEGDPLGAAVHRAGCTMAQRGTRLITADDARQPWGCVNLTADLGC
ncbi:DUF6233 domain-containing protein [Streptomyces sp. NPDC007162]|uniref:DUF6233 domain-containing protein n=1 Tax=Streptomyces sp. NPDC007162 TaxID=3156917 RepID=UPI0033C3870A